MDLGEVKRLLDKYREAEVEGDRATTELEADPWDAKAVDTRAALLSAVRSLVERARREGREEAAVRIERAGYGHWGRFFAAKIRALTPAVPGAADEEG